MKKILGILLAALLLAGLASGAFADITETVTEGEITDDVNVEANYAYAVSSDGTEITDNGTHDVHAESESFASGVRASGGTVTVGGSASAESGYRSYGVEAYYGAAVTVGADASAESSGNGDTEAYGVYADAAEVTVGGNASGTSTGSSYAYAAGVEAVNGSTVTVHGDAEGYAGDCGDAYGVLAYEEFGSSAFSVSPGSNPGPAGGASVTVEGNVIAEGQEAYGICATSGSTVTVGKDVTAASYSSDGFSTGAYVYNSTVIIEGDLSSQGADASALELEGLSTAVIKKTASTSGEFTIAVYADTSASSGMNAMAVYQEPAGGTVDAKVLVGKLEKGSRDYAAVYDEEYEIDPDATESFMKNNVYYIVTAVGDGYTLGGDDLDEQEGCMVTRETIQDGNQFLRTLHITSDNAIERVDVGDNTVSEASGNPDGSWTVFVRRGGDLTIAVTFKRNDNGTYTVSYQPAASVKNEDGTYSFLPKADKKGVQLKINYNVISPEKLRDIQVLVDYASVSSDDYSSRILEDGTVDISFTDNYLASLGGGVHMVTVILGDITYTAPLERPYV